IRIAVWVARSVTVKLLPVSLRRRVRPSVFVEQYHFHAHLAASFNGVAEIVRHAEARIGIMRWVSPVLAAVVPPRKLNGFDSVPGTIFPVLHQLFVRE